MSMSRIVVGSRESRLAVVQSMTVVDFLRSKHPGIDVELLTMKTTGDKILDRTLDKVGGKGLFVKELDIALREHRADVTVHSLKDMPMEAPQDLPILCCSRREDPRDALVLAAAGLKRMGLANRVSRYFGVDEIIPAAGQGIMAVQGRADFDRSLLDGYADADAGCAATAERAFVRELDGGCTSPVCAHAALDGDGIHLIGLYWEESDGSWRKGSVRGLREQAERLGVELARTLRDGREA